MAGEAMDRERVDIRLKADEKAVITRAAALMRQDVTGFILSAILPRAEKIIREAEQVSLSEKDSLKVLNLLENPPEPTDRLIRAAGNGNTLA